MRIISQDGMIDVPYEQMIININYINNVQIMACGSGSDSEHSIFPIAKYSTEAKAHKAMSMLHDAYCGIDSVSQKFIDGKVKDIADAIRNGFIPPITINNSEKQKDYRKNKG